MLVNKVWERARSVRLRKGMTQADVAKESGLSMNYISRFETGEFENPTLSTLEKVARGLGVSLVQLQHGGLFGDGQAAENLAKLRAETEWKGAVRLVPVLGKAACGGWTNFRDLAYPASHSTRREMAPTKDPYAFYVIASGRSMTGAGIEEGDLVLVEPSSQVNNGDLVFAQATGKGCTIKKFKRFETGRIILSPTNPEFDPIIIDDADENFRVYRVGSRTTKY